MFEAQANEFPFMADLPKREKGRIAKAIDSVREMVALQERVGPIIPAALAVKVLNISRQRFHQLVNDGRIKTVQFHGYHYITEADLVEFAKSERSAGRPPKAPTFMESVKMAREFMAEERSDSADSRRK